MTLQLKLYVAGRSPLIELAVANLHSALERDMRGDFDLVVNDVLQHPELAEEQNILATPTLVKERPLPVRRIIGDFSDTEKVLYLLELQPYIGKQGGRTDES